MRRTIGERIYRAMLLAYPAHFRNEFADDMVQLFRDRARDGGSAVARWYRLIADVFWQSIQERLQRSRRGELLGPDFGGSRGYGSAPRGSLTDMFDTTRKDIGYALRTLWRNPVFTVIAVATLALGIGANTAIFSVINGVVLQPLQFGDPSRLAVIWETNPAENEDASETAVGTFLDWREKNESFADLTIWTWDTFVLQSDDDSRVLDGAWVYPNFFSVLQFSPLMGRTFMMSDAPTGQRSDVVMISHALWRDRWGGDPEIIGESIRLDGGTATIIGVMRPDVAAPDPGVDIWVAAGLQSPTRWERHARRYTVFGRLQDGMTVQQAQADMSRISAELRAGEYSDIYEGWDARVVPLQEQIVGDARATLLIALACVGFVLLIACVNIANMLLARATVRQREIALRSALGAGRGRITRQLLTESVILALLGGGIGVVFAAFTHSMLLRFEPGIIPRAEELSIDGWALAFALGIAITTGFLFGLVPALQGTRIDLQDALKAGGGKGMTVGRRQARMRGGLVTAQLALSTILLCGAGLLMRSMFELSKVDPGFDTRTTLAARVFLDANRFSSEEALRDYYQGAQDAIAAVPGVRAVGASSALPMDPMGINYDLPYRLDRHAGIPDNQLPAADFRVVTPGFFNAMGIPVTSGRGVEASDRTETVWVMVVNEAMAEAAWPGQEPLGQIIDTPSTDWARFQVVGVVANTRYYGLDSEPRPEMYVAHSQVPRNNMSYVVSASGNPSGLVESVRRAVAGFDPAQPAHSVVPVTDLVSNTVSASRFYTLVLGIFAAVALALSAAGIYGVLTYWVNQRTNEIGVRIALGSSANGVLRLVVGHGMTYTTLGVVVGLVGAFASTRVLSNVLFGVGSADPVTFVVVTGVLASIALLACWLPAFRASRVDPVVALREE